MLRRLVGSIRFQLIFAEVAMVALSMLFLVLFFHYTISENLQTTTYADMENLINQTHQTLESSLSMVENAMEHFFSNKSLRQWVAADSHQYAVDSSRLLSRIQLDNDLEYSVRLNGAWDSRLVDSAFFFVDKSCFCMFSRSDQRVKPLTDRNFDIFQRMSATPRAGFQIFPPLPEEGLIFFGASLYNLNDTSIALNLIMGVNEETLRGRYELADVYPGTVVCVIDAAGIVCSSPDTAQLGAAAGETVQRLAQVSELGEISIGGEIYYAVSRPIATSGLRFVIGVPKSEMTRTMNESVARYLLFLLLIFAVLLALSVVAFYRLTSFFKDINKHLNHVKQGDYSTRMPAYDTVEMRRLSESFNGMADRIDYLVHEIYEKQLVIKETSIKFLQSQINPHFLFNTLAAISTKAKMVGDESIYKMVRAVSLLLQAGFSVDNDAMITAAEELEYVRCYLYIQQERFGDRFSREINVADESLLSLELPRLCVEPVVENAVTHGLENRAAQGRVTISLSRDGTDVVFVVEDNGVGFPPEVRTLDDLLENRSEHGSGIGLRNTDRRLKLIYGEKYGVFLDSAFRPGARVIVRVPYTLGGEGVVPSDGG